MYNHVLACFAEFLEKQDVLCRLTESRELHGYSYSEIHTIRAIHNLSLPNVTSIAKYLKLTKSAISKVAKKLISQGLINTYMLPNNKQKIFFSLTEKGEELYGEHEKRHSLWQQRDSLFFSSFSKQDLEIITSFMNQYNQYLEDQIEELSREGDLK